MSDSWYRITWGDMSAPDVDINMDLTCLQYPILALYAEGSSDVVAEVPLVAALFFVPKFYDLLPPYAFALNTVRMFLPEFSRHTVRNFGKLPKHGLLFSASLSLCNDLLKILANMGGVNYFHLLSPDEVLDQEKKLNNVKKSSIVIDPMIPNYVERFSKKTVSNGRERRGGTKKIEEKQLKDVNCNSAIEKKMKISCDTCSKTFKNRSAYLSHRSVSHKNGAKAGDYRECK